MVRIDTRIAAFAHSENTLNGMAEVANNLRIPAPHPYSSGKPIRDNLRLQIQRKREALAEELDKMRWAEHMAVTLAADIVALEDALEAYVATDAHPWRL